MNNAVKETLCTSCNHRDVCTYMNDYLYILDAVSNAYATQLCRDGIVNPDGTVYIKKATTDTDGHLTCFIEMYSTFDFIGDISISCRHYQKSIAEGANDEKT